MATAQPTFPKELRHGSGAAMSLDQTRLLLAFKTPHKQQDVSALLKQYLLILEDESDKRDSNARLPETNIVNHTTQRFWVRTLDGRALEPTDIAALQKALGDQLAWIGPVYRLSGSQNRNGLLCPVPNALLLRLASTKVSAGDVIGPVVERYKMTEVPEKSKYLGAFHYYELTAPDTFPSYAVQSQLLDVLKGQVRDVKFENMPLLKPLANAPNDTLFPQQWDMTMINAGGAGTTGWDLSTGDAGTVVCVLDTGCDLTHPDLAYSSNGIRLDTMGPDGAPTDNHGTCCAGIVGARFNNALGSAGVGGNLGILPVAFVNWTDVEVASGINYAADNGAKVISMSFGQYPASEGYIFDPAWDFTIIDPAIAHAHDDQDVVLCAASGNEDLSTHNRYPARHPLVIACGASDEADNRKTTTSPDGENWWGSCYGVDTYLGQTTEVSVVAPGVHIPTTDRQGTDGYNTSAGTAGDYFLTFNGTSSATPHVAGLAGVIRSVYPSLTNDQVRTILERTADKAGTVSYAEVAGFPNGSRNQEMGYGRINMYKALDFADVLIRDYGADTGAEPSTPPSGDFWDFSDMVVRIFDDNVFVPSDPTKSSNVERGQTNYVYVQVTNNGPNEASNVTVNCRITPFVGLQFQYPADWTTVDATHVSPTPVTNTFASIPSGGSAMAKFTVSSAQVEDLWGWISSHPWHPCMLASVTSDNDYAFATAIFTMDPDSQRKNNLAQRNLSVIDVIGDAAIAWPMIAGHLANAERTMEIMVDRSALPKTMPLLLELDYDGKAFPQVDFTSASSDDGEDDCATVFLERTRMEVTLGCCSRGVLTVEKGSRLECVHKPKLGQVDVLQGGEVILRKGKRYVEVRDDRVLIRMEKQPNQLFPLALHTTIPANSKAGQQYRVAVAQRNIAGVTAGGAGVVWIVK
jgi:subtilisin family serine protease